MKRKLLSLLLCAAMFIGVLPAVSFADSTASAGAKLGIENGDIVRYAGKDGTPIKWRVIDSAKSNTGDTSGMLLLSENTLYDVTSTSTSVGWLDSDCNAFYNAYFSDAYKEAVMTVSKTDSNYTYNSNVFEGRLSNAAVFALSAEELENLPASLKKFPNSSNWWLRSMCPKGTLMPLSFYSYANAEAGNFAALLTSASKNTIKLRPAVNLDKNKLAKIGDKLLLLPADESSSEWKLSLKNNISMTAYTAYNTELNINTNSMADCISVVIVKNDGSISYYKQYEQTALKQTIPVTLPSDTDAKTDSMYVFAEKTGSVSDPVKVCISHNFAYTELGDSAHSAKCSDCGYEVTQSHNFGTYTVTDQGHEQTCSVCGFVKAENHKFGSYTITEQGHEQTCSVCNFVKTENHTLTYTSNDAKTHNAACVCGYTEKNLEHIYNTKIGETAQNFTCSDCGAAHFTALNGMFDDKALRDEYEVDTAAINDTPYSSANSIFTDDNTTVMTTTDSTGTLELTFETKRPVRATGFQIKMNGTLPKTISLYGENSENDYEEIGTAALRSIIDGKPNGKTYSFVFSAKSDFNAYNSFKATMNFNSDAVADIAYFGLISEKAIAAANLNLTGIMAADAPDLMYSGEDYIASFISGNGYPKANNFSIFEDNKMFGTDYWEYSADTGIMKIFNQYIKENSIYEINGFCNDKVTVKFNSQTLTLTNNDREALFGQEYVAEFAVISGRQELAPKSLNDITVINKNGDITHLCTLDSEGKLHIPGELLIGGVKDSIEISAEEAGKKLPQEQAAVKVTKSGDDDRYFANMDDAKAVIESDGDTDITLLKDADSSVTVTLSGKKTNIDLSGNTLTAKSDSEIFHIKNSAQVSISNGAFAADSAETVIYTDTDGILTLNNVTTPQSEKSVYVSYPSKLILDGANSDVTVYLRDGTFEQKNGTSRLSSDLSIVNNIKLYGGRVATYNIGQVNMFSLIDDGYSFELSDSAMFDDFVRSVADGLSFSVKKGNVITEQPQDITAELGEGARLTVGAADGSSYYWFDPDDCAKCKSDKNYLEISADTPVGKYSYLCAVLTGNTVSGSRIVTVTVVCSHKSVTDGICDGCGIKIAAQATVNGKTQIFENINDTVAFANANENTVIQLSDNVTIDDYVSFSGKNTTLDMNGKTFASSNTNRFITVNGDSSLTVIGNGNMTARLLAEDSSTVNIENGTFEEVSAGNNSALTVNGGTFTMLNASGGTVTVNDGKITLLNARSTTVLNGGIFDEIFGSNFYTLLPEGKAFVGADDNKFNTAEYEYYKGSDSTIKDVTIADAPFAITQQPKGGFIAEGTKDAVVSVGVEKNEAYNGEIEYNWISGTMSYDDEFTLENENAGAAATVTIDTNDLGGGVQKTYQCTVSYEGYVLSTDYATFTIGKGKPVVDFEEGYINSCGNDCLIIAAVYNGSELLATHTEALSKDDTFIDVDTVFSPLFEKIGEDESIDKIKIFFWDSLGNMKPIRDAAEPSAF